MAQKNREPKLPVNKKETMEHALLTIRRAWAGEVRDFENGEDMILIPNRSKGLRG